jgi:hypothetical protein
MTGRRAGLFVTASLLLAAPRVGGAQELPPPEHYVLRVEYVRWFPSVSGEVQKDASEVSRVDVEDDLGVEQKDVNEFKAAFRFGSRHKLRGAYNRLDYDGDVVLASPFIFDGTFFRGGTRTVTSLKGTLWSGDYELDVLKGGWGFLGLLIGARFLDVDAVIVQPEEGLRETGTLRAPVPVLGVSGRVYAGRLSLSAEVSGLTIGSRGTFYDAEGYARYHVTDRLALGGGFRLFSVRGEDDSDFIRLRQHGARLSVELSL